MTSTSRWTAIGATCLVLTPLVTAAADLMRMSAESSGAPTGLVDAYGTEQASATLSAIEANLGAYEIASWLALAAAVLAVPAVATVRRLTVTSSRRWSAGALVIGICLVVGQFVHLMGYYAWNQILVSISDREAAAAVAVQSESNTFAMVVFAPYLVGALLFFPVAAVALRRSGAIPRRAVVLVVAAGAAMAVIGSSFVSSPIWGTATALGMLPVLVGQLRSARTSSRMVPSAATEVSTSSSVVR